MIREGICGSQNPDLHSQMGDCQLVKEFKKDYHHILSSVIVVVHTNYVCVLMHIGLCQSCIILNLFIVLKMFILSRSIKVWTLFISFSSLSGPCTFYGVITREVTEAHIPTATGAHESGPARDLHHFQHQPVHCQHNQQHFAQ